MPESVIRAQVNPDLLVWARSTSGYSIEDVARSVGVDATVVVDWEHGRRWPTLRQLQSFANKVKRPLAALFLPVRPQEPPPPDDYRILPGAGESTFQPGTLLAIRKVRNALASFAGMVDESATPMQMDLPQVSLREEPESAAGKLREKLRISVSTQLEWQGDYVALREWRDALFGIGVLTFQFTFPNSDARGFNLMEYGLGAIAVSTEDAVVARIFSLFHECSHLCLRRPGVSGPPVEVSPSLERNPAVYEVERFCDRFAAAFLLPLSDPEVVRRLRQLAEAELDDRKIAYLAGKFKVSREMLIRRAEFAGYVSRDTLNEFVQRWRSQVARRKPGFALPNQSCLSHYGRGYVSLVLDAMDSGRLSDVDAARYLDVNPKWFGRVRAGLFSGGTNE